ncbi:MAG: M1 family peptidase [Deltaproteobacteria bacterium]|nr:MAG: M1 family peptidase [Deltaproteobacteria bacterium]
MSRLAPNPRPESYALKLKVDPRRDRFQGEVEIGLSVTPGLREIELHAVDLELGESTLEDSAGPVTISRVSSHSKRETLCFHLERELRGRRARLHIAYEGPLRTDLRGLYQARSGRRRYAVTQLEAADARRFFPCFDEPDKKARFQLQVTTPVRNQVISNAPIVRTHTQGRLKTVQFAETPKLSTYLVALVCGELEGSRARRCGPTPIRVWHVPGKRHLTRFALDTAVASLERLEHYFGLRYPYAKLDLIAVPDFEFGAMENAGAVIFRESLLLVDPKTVTLSERKRVAEVIAHELAHMWYGNLVTMAWWDDLWLNEAFATWMAFRVIDDWQPDWQMWLDFEHHRAAAYALDSLTNTHPIYTDVKTPEEATENFDAITYEKGASVVRMLERWLGSSVFRRGVRRYIRRHRESNARAADLWQALEQVSGEPVGSVAKAWIERPGFPLVSVRCKERAGHRWLETRQERFFANPHEPAEKRRAHWPLPMRVRVRVRTPRRRDRIVRGLLRSARDELDLGPAQEVGWVYANADESGFYRPLHDAKLLGAMASELERLTPAERMGLLGHQWAGVRADRAPLEDFLGLVEALRNEREPEVLEAVVGPLAWLHDQAVPAIEPDSPGSYRAWLLSIFAESFRELSWSARRAEPDAVRLRRAALLRILGGVAEDPGISGEAESRASAYLRNRAALDANLAGPVVEIAARNGTKARYQAYLRTMRRARTPQERTRFELALGAFRDPALVARTLELLLSKQVPTQDVVPLAVRLLANPAAREETWRFIRSRWKALAPRVPPGLAPRLVSALPALQTRRHRESVAAFFRSHPLPTAARALQQTLERFDLDAELRGRVTPKLRRWLTRHRQTSS